MTLLLMALELPSGNASRQSAHPPGQRLEHHPLGGDMVLWAARGAPPRRVVALLCGRTRTGAGDTRTLFFTPQPLGPQPLSRWAPPRSQSLLGVVVSAACRACIPRLGDYISRHASGRGRGGGGPAEEEEEGEEEEQPGRPLPVNRRRIKTGPADPPSAPRPPPPLLPSRVMRAAAAGVAA